MSLLSLVPRVEAAFIPSGESQNELMRDQDMQIIKKALENKVITQRLQDLGFSDGFSDQEIQDRMDQLSDQEVHNLATQIDSVSQGGIFGVVIAVLVIVILVLVILKIMD
jgi:hypothetical protein